MTSYKLITAGRFYKITILYGSLINDKRTSVSCSSYSLSAGVTYGPPRLMNAITLYACPFKEKLSLLGPKFGLYLLSQQDQQDESKISVLANFFSFLKSKDGFHAEAPT